MSGLIIRHGSPQWWTSPDIWVAEPGTGGATVVASPVAGQTYEVWVRGNPDWWPDPVVCAAA
jgi:hypothetical protein